MVRNGGWVVMGTLEVPEGAWRAEETMRRVTDHWTCWRQKQPGLSFADEETQRVRQGETSLTQPRGFRNEFLPMGIASPCLMLGDPELSHRPRGWRLLGGCWGPLGGHRGPHVPPTAPRGCWAVCWGRSFSCHWVPLSSFPFPQTLCSRACLAWTHPPFHAYYISCLKSGDPTMSKVGGVITWRCMRRRFFLLNTSNVLLCDYRRACRAPVTRLADKMAPG